MDTFYLTDPERIAASYLRFLTERYDLSEPAELFRDVVSCEFCSRIPEDVDGLTVGASSNHCRRRPTICARLLPRGVYKDIGDRERESRGEFIEGSRATVI